MAVELRNNQPDTAPNLTTFHLTRDSSTSLKLATFEELCQQAIEILKAATPDNPVLKIQVEEECIDPPDSQPLPILEEALPSGKIGHPLVDSLDLKSPLETAINRAHPLTHVKSREGGLSNPNLSPQGVNALVEKACQGSGTAFGILYQTYIDKIYNYIYYKTSHSVDAEDLTEQVFMKTWEAVRRGKFMDQGVPFGAWLFKVARNVVIDHYRTKKEHSDLTKAYDVMAHEGDPEDLAQRRATDQILMTAIKRLTDDQQQVILMRFGDSMNNTEISAAMGKKEGAIRALQYRALLALQRILSDERYGLDKKPANSGDRALGVKY